MTNTVDNGVAERNNDGQTLSKKDFLIPGAIVIAGIFVGGGLYMGGSPVTNEGLGGVPTEPVLEATDNTDKVRPVTEDDHIRGSVSAPVKIVEFSDFDCPFCSRFHDTMRSVMEKYSGEEVAWVYRQFPLEQLHPQAPLVAAYSECVADISGDEGFWKFADSYFSARGSGDKTSHSELLPKIVAELGLNASSIKSCAESQSTQEKIQSDMNDGVATGGKGTPWSIIIGPTGKTYPINGALPEQAIEQAIELAKKEA